MRSESQPHIAESPKEEFVPTELTSEADLTQFWMTHNRNNNLSLSHPDRERRASMLKAQETLEEQRVNPTLHAFGVKDGETIIATGMFEVWEDPDNIKRGFLSHDTVDMAYRGKGIAKRLTDVRMQLAKEYDCPYVDCIVSAQNPIGLVTKFNDHFVLRDITFYLNTGDAEGFSLTKKLETGTEPYKEPEGELEEIPLTDLKTIEARLEEGWTGIDLKNQHDATDNDPHHWTLIMVKNDDIKEGPAT